MPNLCQTTIKIYQNDKNYMQSQIFIYNRIHAYAKLNKVIDLTYKIKILDKFYYICREKSFIRKWIKSLKVFTNKLIEIFRIFFFKKNWKYIIVWITIENYNMKSTQHEFMNKRIYYQLKQCNFDRFLTVTEIK